MKRLTILASVLTLLLSASAVSASTIVYSQAVMHDIPNRTSSPINYLGGVPGYITADNFTLGSDTDITDLHWWGELVAGGTDFLFTFYADDAGAPGAVLATRQGSLTSTPVSLSGVARSYYSSDLLSPFSAVGGTKYWLSIFNQAPDAIWAWQAAADPGDGSRQQLLGTSTWPATFDVAFELSSGPTGATAVPEPASLTLLGLGIAAGARRWRRRQ